MLPFVPDVLSHVDVKKRKTESYSPVKVLFTASAPTPIQSIRKAIRKKSVSVWFFSERRGGGHVRNQTFRGTFYFRLSLEIFQEGGGVA